MVNATVRLLLCLLSLAICPTRRVAGCDELKSVRPQPNIILINLDDADYRMFAPNLVELYPSLKLLINNSVSFTNFHVTTPFCGPSRASLFRGQYAHRTGVRVNIPESPLSLSFKGGYSEFLRQGYDREELGVWMKRAGYRTMMIGKYHHNGFDFRKPPGWDDFFMSNGGRYQGTYRFTTKDNPVGAHSQNPEEVYRTDQEAEDAVRLIRNHMAHSSSNQRLDALSNSHVDEKAEGTAGHTMPTRPFFLYVAPLAPHRPVGSDFTKMVDKKKYGGWQPDLRLPSTPDFDEAQMSDKPLHHQSPPYSEAEIEVLQAEYLSRARAVKSVDDLVRRLLDTIDECRLKENTFVFFTSDNGYQLGQHRLHNKLDPYQMCTNVPLFVSGPGVAPGKTAHHLLAHIDLCPTILELAGAKIPKFVDGKSFVPLLTNPSEMNERTWRDPVVIENWQAKPNRGKILPGTYSGLRYFDRVYVEWATGDKEYYDLANDPFELENIYLKLNEPERRALKQDLLGSRHVAIDPILTVISGPIITGDDPDFIRGRAEDDRVIRSVVLTIQDSNTSKYWDGHSWIAEPFELSAELSAINQQMVSWRYQVDLPAASVLNVIARATDESGNESEVVSRTITIGSDDSIKKQQRKK